jgi:hypothetical protein
VRHVERLDGDVADLDSAAVDRHGQPGRRKIAEAGKLNRQVPQVRWGRVHGHVVLQAELDGRGREVIAVRVREEHRADVLEADAGPGQARLERAAREAQVHEHPRRRRRHQQRVAQAATGQRINE